MLSLAVLADRGLRTRQDTALAEAGALLERAIRRHDELARSAGCVAPDRPGSRPRLRTRMMHYFAYGANMDRTHMRGTAPGAVELGIATLGAHRVAIARAGYGTLVPDAQQIVHGVLWRLTPQDEAALDRFEAVDRGVYRKDSVRVRAGDREVEAMVYLAVDGAPGVASPDYVRQVAEAARASQLPAEYVHILTELPQDGSTEPWIPPVGRSDE